MNGFISIIAKLGPKPEPVADPITALRNRITHDIEDTLYAEKVDTHKLKRLYGEAFRVTTAALRKGVQ